jgi:hypothetical protein
MTDPAKLIELAERVEAIGCDIVCPLCGDTDFDVPGFSLHMSIYCDVVKAITAGKDNLEVSQHLRAMAVRV